VWRRLEPAPRRPHCRPQDGRPSDRPRADDVDFVDPAETYYAFGYTVHYAVNRPLYSYGPGDEADPRSDLAAGAPRISADARTVTVRIKPGIRYAPPVDREVTAKDVKYAFERAFSAHVASPYAGLYFGDIVGAPAKPGAIADIPGIQTPDDHTIVFRLSKPSALQLTEALAMPISTPVPEEYARRFDAKTPSTYDDHVAFTGPYMYRNDSSGRLVGHRPGKVIELVRNPNWDPRTDYRPAYLNAITIREGNRDAVSAARRVLAGSALVLGDTSAPGPVVKEALGPPPRPDRLRARRRLPLRRHQHHDQAVRQPRRAPGGRGRRRPSRPAALARRRRGRARGDALPAAGLPRPRRGRRGQGHRRGLPGQSARGHGRRPALHARGQAARTRACRSTPPGGGPAAGRC
jgi:hypothetical protein